MEEQTLNDDERTQKNKTEPTASPKNEKLFTVFDLEGEEYGLEVDMMDEIVRDVEISRVPGSSEQVIGATNLRGEVIPVIDLKTILGLGENRDEVQDTIIIQIDQKKLAAPVDRVKDIISPEEDQLIDPTDITNLDDRRLRWIIRLETGRSVRVINVKKVVEKEIKNLDIDTENEK